MENLLRNFVYGFRLMAKSPSSTALSALLLSIAIGMVSIVYAFLEGAFRGLPFDESDNIVYIERVRADQDFNEERWRFEEYKTLQSQQKSFSELVAIFSDPVIFANGDRKRRSYSGYVETNFFDTVRVQPQLGRFFRSSDADPSAELTMVITDSFWESEFERAPDVLGKRVLVDGISRTIIGVAKPRFDFPFGFAFWMPMTVDTLRTYTGRGESVFIFGRLNNGISYEEAQQEVTLITKQLETSYPETSGNYISAEVGPFIDFFVGSNGKRFWVTLFALTLMVLLMACANVSNIMMGKTIRRQSELAIRSAMGASRVNLIAQLLTETLAIALLSILGSLLFAEAYFVLFLGPLFEEMSMPSWMGVEIEMSYFLFVAFISICAVALSGLFPALRSTGRNLQDLLRESTRTGSSGKVGRFSRILISFQICLAVIVLSGVGITLTSMLYEQSQFDFYDTNDIVCGWLNLDANNFPEPEDRFPIFETFRKEVEAHPAFSGLAISNEHSLRFRTVPVGLDGVSYPTDSDRPEWLVRIASPGYFKTLGIEVLEGREFTPEDIHGAPLVAMVTKKTADRIWPGESAIGKRIIIDRNATSASDPSSRKETLTIVGVFPDVWNSSVYGFDADGFARPLGQETWGSICFYAKGKGNFASLEQALRDIGNKTHEHFAVTQFSPLNEVIARSYLFEKLVLKLIIGFAIGAIAMVAGGLYGVLSYAVSQRKQEMAIRMAVGADAGRIMRMTFFQGLKQVAWGVGLGLIGAVGVARVMSETLRPYYPNYASLVLILAGLVFISMFAIVIPSWRASAVEPMRMLRAE